MADSSEPKKTGNRPPAPKVRLSCDLCRQRKVKCNRETPCTNCRRAGVTCIPVHRQRLPRGRHASSNTGRDKKQSRAEQQGDVDDRVSRLEQMIRGDGLLQHHTARGASQSVGTQSNPTSTASSTPGLGTTSPYSSSARGLSSSQALMPFSSVPSVAGPETGRYITGPFWDNLVKEIQGLRDTLEHLEVDDNTDTDTQTVGSSETTEADAGILGFGFAQPENIAQQDLRSDPKKISQLCLAYIQNVDPLFKILHRPSIRAHMVDGQPYLSYNAGHLAVEALTASVCFAAAATLSEESCRLQFSMEKQELVSETKLCCERALGKADLSRTTDLATLQAFVLFLIATRTCDPSRRVWTMISLAVRLAQALSLHLESSSSAMGQFKKEARHRLWHAISFLDIQTSLDRASEPLISAHWMRNIQLPGNLNDEDINLTAANDIQRHESNFTESTFSIITWMASSVYRALHFGMSLEADNSQKAHKDPTQMRSGWSMRQQQVDNYRERASSLLQQCDTENIDLHWYTHRVAEAITASLQLAAVRPLRKQPDCSPIVRGSSLLMLAVDVLNKTHILGSDPRALQYAWFDPLFVQWHSLAVALAEVYVCEDQSLILRSWPLIEWAFDGFKAKAADAQGGIPWYHIQKLMSKTWARVNAMSDKPMPMFSPAKKGQGSSNVSRVGSFTGSTPLASTASNSSLPDLAAWSSNSSSASLATLTPSSSVLTVDPTDLDQWQSQYMPQGKDLSLPFSSNDFMDPNIGFDGGDPAGLSWGNWESFIEDLQVDENGMVMPTMNSMPPPHQDTSGLGGFDVSDRQMQDFTEAQGTNLASVAGTA